MLFKLTISNIKTNFDIYKIYFLSTTIILSIFLSFLNFVSDKIILDRISENSRVEMMAKSIYICLLCILIFFLIYFNNFFLKHRSREIGILSLLGFSKNKLIKLLSYENLVILILSYLVSLILGTVIYYGLKSGIILFLKLKVNMTVYIYNFSIFHNHNINIIDKYNN